MRELLESYNDAVQEWNERFGDSVMGYTVTEGEIERGISERVRGFVSDEMTARQKLQYTRQQVGEFATAQSRTGEGAGDLPKGELAFLIRSLAKRVQQEL